MVVLGTNFTGKTLIPSHPDTRRDQTMSATKLEKELTLRLDALKKAGSLKDHEMVISGLKPAQGDKGPRHLIEGYGDKEFLRMNSNSYLGLSLNQEIIEAEEAAAKSYGAGPGAVRFISGTCRPHIELEKKLAAFHKREAAMIFSSAYAAVMGVITPLIFDDTIVVSDELNHNCIINAVRLSRPKIKAVYAHLDMADLEQKIQNLIGKGNRVLIVTDGIFSMRGDFAPLDKISKIAQNFDSKFEGGVNTLVDDSHGIGAFGKTGRGTEEYTRAEGLDILVATLGKSLGVNGILATGLNYPVVPKGDEEIRFQVSADHTEADIDYVLEVLKKFKESQ